jgi:hypothetical protein
MTRNDLLQRMSEGELMLWQALYTMEAEDRRREKAAGGR